MSDHESLLHRALRDWLGADAALKALLGDPARVWDQPPEDPVWPHLLIGPGQSRPVRADGGGVEHRISLTCMSRFGGTEEAKAVNAAVRARLNAGPPSPDGLSIVSLGVTLSEIFRSRDLRRVLGVVRLRIVTEDI